MYQKKNPVPIRSPIDKGLAMLGGKWKGRILCVLACRKTPQRYGQLRQEMVNVTDTALSDALRELVRDGLVERCQYNEVPPRVEYRLTAYGQRAIPLLLAIADWADGTIPSELARGEMPLCLECSFQN